MRRRLAAVAAIVGGLSAVAATAYVFVDEFPRGIVVFLAIIAASAAAWQALLRRGSPRVIGFVLATALLVLAAAVLLAGSDRWLLAVIAIAAAVGIGAARPAFKPTNSLAPAVSPSRPVLFINPRSGDGRAARAGLADAARERGLQTAVLEPGDDLADLVRSAVEGGADGLAMAGGDGSQALVAAIAAEHGLPYACIPSGTRNHFALDLGVDRDDVVGALDALLPGARERLVDLAEVNGRTFVNNVCLGVYAEAVSHRGYRESKLGTLLDSVAENLGPGGHPGVLRWRDPDGVARTNAALLLVTNNPYRLGPLLGSGTRPRLDLGQVGIIDFRPPDIGTRPGGGLWRQITVPEIEIDADGHLPLGVDGEALTMQPPLRFRSRPRALRVLIAGHHPGASPAATAPASLLAGLRALGRLALLGRA